MTATTLQETILATLRTATRPLDDDQPARRTGISPRQAVNEICRALAANGVLRRVIGPDGKLVNELVQMTPPPSLVDVQGLAADEAVNGVEGIPAAEPPVEPIAGNSFEQRRAEGEILASVSTALGVSLAPAAWFTLRVHGSNLTVQIPSRPFWWRAGPVGHCEGRAEEQAGQRRREAAVDRPVSLASAGAARHLCHRPGCDPAPARAVFAGAGYRGAGRRTRGDRRAGGGRGLDRRRPEEAVPLTGTARIWSIDAQRGELQTP